MTLLTGKSYYGAHNQRYVLVGIEDDQVTLLAPIVHEYVNMTLEEFTEWMSHSTRRNYLHNDGTRRIKIDTTDENIIYVDPMYPHLPITVTQEEWDDWRKDAV